MSLRRTLGRLGHLGPLAAVTAFAPPLGTLLLIGTIQDSSAWLQENPRVGVAVFVAGAAVTGGLALLPTYTPSLLGGWAFGIPLGLAATLLGFLGAATIGFFLSRHLSGDRLVQALHDHPRGMAIHDAFVRSGFWKAVCVVTLVRLPPNAPFAMSNLVMAASRVDYLPYAIGTMVGLGPRLAAAVIVGAELATVDLAHPARSWSAFIAIGVTVGVLLALGQIARRALARVAPE